MRRFFESLVSTLLLLSFSSAQSFAQEAQVELKSEIERLETYIEPYLSIDFLNTASMRFYSSVCIEKFSNQMSADELAGIKEFRARLGQIYSRTVTESIDSAPANIKGDVVGYWVGFGSAIETYESPLPLNRCKLLGQASFDESNRRSQ